MYLDDLGGSVRRANSKQTWQLTKETLIHHSKGERENIAKHVHRIPVVIPAMESYETNHGIQRYEEDYVYYINYHYSLSLVVYICWQWVLQFSRSLRQRECGIQKWILWQVCTDWAFGDYPCIQKCSDCTVMMSSTVIERRLRPSSIGKSINLEIGKNHWYWLWLINYHHLRWTVLNPK